MASEPKPTTPPGSSATAPRRDKGIRIFFYPKIIFLLPTLIVAIICWLGMWVIRDRTENPNKRAPQQVSAKGAPAVAAATPAEPVRPASDRFKTPENLLAVLFLGVFAFNLLIMGLDFPRFTVIAVILLVLFGVFFILWMGAAFDIELMQWVRGLMASVYAFANSTFYFLMALIMAVILGIVYVTRWLDYWEILPNEILHHHGPLSDLERYPTTNLKFDKEIPDVLEHMFMGSGRIVLHISEEKKAIVLDNVLFINAVENALKSQMSRMEVRLTTDQELPDL